MNDTDVSHTSPRPSRGWRLIAAWHAMAQLGMLLDGRAHAWSDEVARGEPERRRSRTTDRAPGAPRLARIAA
jgi:hypothetical protein